MNFDWASILPPDPPRPPDAIILPTLVDPNEDQPNGYPSTRGLDRWPRCAAIWCRAHGGDYSAGLRTAVDAVIERIRSRHG